jgi:hypothetical protein
MAGRHKGFLLGEQLQPRDIAARLYRQGWRDAVALWQMLATILAESDGYVAAHGFNLATVSSTAKGAQVLDWHPVDAPTAAEQVAGPLLTVVEPASGICRDPSGKPRHLLSAALVATSVDVGLGQVNIPPLEFTGERHRQLLDPDRNLHACRLLYLKRGLEPWHAWTSGIAGDPGTAGRYAHRAIRGLGNHLAADAGLEPVPLLDYR